MSTPPFRFSQLPTGPQRNESGIRGLTMDIAPGLAGEEDLCGPYLEKLPVTGAAVSLFGGATAESLICASDALAARLDELQFSLGEGPRWRAVRTRLPVLVPDAQGVPHPEWPMFHRAIIGTEAAALFVFPLTIGAADLGVVELYHSAPGTLNRSHQAMAAALAGQTSWYLLRKILTIGSPDTGRALDPALMSRREVHQATGMVLAQAGATAADSLLLLRAHAFAHDLPLRETAQAVLEGRLRFEPGHGGGPIARPLQ